VPQLWEDLPPLLPPQEARLLQTLPMVQQTCPSRLRGALCTLLRDVRTWRSMLVLQEPHLQKAQHQPLLRWIRQAPGRPHHAWGARVQWLVPDLLRSCACGVQWARDLHEAALLLLLHGWGGCPRPEPGEEAV